MNRVGRPSRLARSTGGVLQLQLQLLGCMLLASTGAAISTGHGAPARLPEAELARGNRGQ